MRRHQKKGLINIVVYMLLALVAYVGAINIGNADMEGGDGTVHVESFDLPISALMSDESVKTFKQHKNYTKRILEIFEVCRPFDSIDIEDMPEARKCNASFIYRTNSYKGLVEKYDVNIVPAMMNGVYTEIIVPAQGVAEINSDRILINLHAGGFSNGSKWGGRFEGIPISAVGKFKVVSVDYRMGPEHRFPAASEDIAAVYRALLKDYEPDNIGIYGCSAGGVLTAQSIAWFQKEGLALPGAIAMLCAAASPLDGDSRHIAAAIIGVDLLAENFDYFEGHDMSDPLITPAKSDALLSKFPPSLLISSTRDFALTSVVHTHQQLIRLGVEADLHIWEGEEHAFMYDYDMPDSGEVYDVTAKFFDKHLGKN